MNYLIITFTALLSLQVHSQGHTSPGGDSINETTVRFNFCDKKDKEIQNLERKFLDIRAPKFEALSSTSKRFKDFLQTQYLSKNLETFEELSQQEDLKKKCHCEIKEKEKEKDFLLLIKKEYKSYSKQVYNCPRLINRIKNLNSLNHLLKTEYN